MQKSLQNCLSLSTFQLLTLEEKDFDESKCQSTTTLKPSPKEIESDNQLFRLFYWDSIKFEYAKRLLNLTNNSSTSQVKQYLNVTKLENLENITFQLRWRATKALAKLGNLPDVQYSLLANICNPYAAVGLARMAGSDSRFFAEPPLHHRKYEHKKVMKAIKRLLINLNKQYDHSCLEYFLQTALMDNQVYPKVEYVLKWTIINPVSKGKRRAEPLLLFIIKYLFANCIREKCAKNFIFLVCEFSKSVDSFPQIFSGILIFTLPKGASFNCFEKQEKNSNE